MLKYEIVDNQKEEWVVFVHGIGGSTKTWSKQIDGFSEQYNVNFAVCYPTYVKSIILGGSSLKLSGIYKGAVILANKIKRFVPYTFLYKFFAWFMMPSKSHKKSRLIFLREVVKLKKETMFAWIEYVQFTLHPEQILSKLEFLGKKILFISGDEDRCFIDDAKILAKKMRNTEMKIIEKCGHICSIENWSTFNRIALDFFRR